MATDYIGSVRVYGEKAYQNNRYSETITDPGLQVLDSICHIPNIENLDLSQFTAYYCPNDTNREKPYYVYRKSVSDDNDKVLLGTSDVRKVTVFCNDNNDFTVTNYAKKAYYNNGVGLGVREYMNADGFSYTAPFGGTGASNNGYTVFNSFDMATRTGYQEVIYPIDFAKWLFDCQNIHGFKPLQDLVDGSYTIAGTQRNVPNEYRYRRGYYFLNDEDKVVMRNRNEYYTVNVQVETGSSTYFNRCVSNMNGFELTGENDNIVSVRLPNIISKSDTLLQYTEDTPMAFFLLRGDDGKYWVCVFSNRRYGGYVNITVTEFRNCPISTSTATGSSELLYNNFTYIDEDTFGNVDLFLDKMLSAKKPPAFDDNGPDAEGPGDVYEDESNAGESVGGDSNIVDDVTPPDTTPNTSYEDFVINNGIFGTYKLTEDNARNYVKTLRILHDSEWIPGEAGDKCEVMANLIHENTLSLYMLPIRIPDEDCEDVVFNVGTKGIRTVDVLGDFGQESSLDHTKLVKKLHSKYDYDLGTLSHYYDNFLDFAPYSSASMYIPYIGKVELPINLIQSTSLEEKRLGLSFRIDRTNGDMLVLLTVNNIPVCRWTGNCAKSIPLLVTDNSGVLQNQLGRLTSAFASGLNAIGSSATTNVPGIVSNIGGMFATSLAPGAPINTSSHIVGSAPESGDIGWLDSQVCTIIIERPIWWKPYDYGELVGYPTKKIAKLASVEGFAKITDIHIRCKATESEKERLKTMLAEGCIF